jgi:hypothetical protein
VPQIAQAQAELAPAQGGMRLGQFNHLLLD